MERKDYASGNEQKQYTYIFFWSFFPSLSVLAIQPVEEYRIQHALMLTWNINLCLYCGLQSYFTYYFLYLFTVYICFPFKVDFYLKKKSKNNSHSNLLKRRVNSFFGIVSRHFIFI